MSKDATMTILNRPPIIAFLAALVFAVFGCGLAGCGFYDHGSMVLRSELADRIVSSPRFESTEYHFGGSCVPFGEHLLLTNLHVVAEMEEMEIDGELAPIEIIAQGEVHAGNLIRPDGHRHDWALVRVPESIVFDPPAFEFGYEPRVGEVLYVIGYPMGTTKYDPDESYET